MTDIPVSGKHIQFKKEALPLIPRLLSMITRCETRCIEVFMSLIMIAWSIVLMLPMEAINLCSIRLTEITSVVPAWFIAVIGFTRLGSVILDLAPLRRFTAFWSMLFWLFVTGLYWHKGFMFPDLAVFPLYAITCAFIYLQLGERVRSDKLIKVDGDERNWRIDG